MSQLSAAVMCGSFRGELSNPNTTSERRNFAATAPIVWPCLPVSAPKPPSGKDWLHEVKHDGFRVIARKTGKRVKLYSRPGNDLTYRFPLIVEAMAKLRSRSCIVDGEGDRAAMCAAETMSRLCLRWVKGGGLARSSPSREVRLPS